jgi:dienelactone hydrolase
MSGYAANTQTGRIFAGEQDTIFMPRDVRKGKRVCVLLHAHLTTAQTAGYEWLDATNFPASVILAAYLASNGIPCITGQMGSQASGNDFANDEGMSRVTAAISTLQAAVPGCATDKAVLGGLSMGGGTAARYAMLNPASVAAVYGIIPMADISDIYVNNRAGVQAEIGTAWGVTYPTALPSGADLPGQAHLAASVPCRLDYGGADPTVLPSTVQALAAAWGANCTATQTDNTLGHGDALSAKTDPKTVYQFFVANGC